MTARPVPDKRFRQLLDAAPDAMVVVDGPGNVVALNLETERLFGWADPDLLGEPSNRLFPQRFQHVYDGLGLSDGGSLETPLQRGPVRIFARRRDGSEFPVEIHRRPLAPIEDALSLVTIRDLTAWRDVQESLFRQKEQAVDTLASIADWVIATDVGGTITYLNPTAERLTGGARPKRGAARDHRPHAISDARGSPSSIPVRCMREGRAVDADGALWCAAMGRKCPSGTRRLPCTTATGAPSAW
jgi:PAS domain S-box-containing protein